MVRNPPRRLRGEEIKTNTKLSLSTRLFLGIKLHLNTELSLSTKLSLSTRLFLSIKLHLNIELSLSTKLVLSTKLFLSIELHLNTKLFLNTGLLLSTELFLSIELHLSTEIFSSTALLLNNVKGRELCLKSDIAAFESVVLYAPEAHAEQCPWDRGKITYIQLVLIQPREDRIY